MKDNSIAIELHNINETLKDFKDINKYYKCLIKILLTIYFTKTNDTRIIIDNILVLIGDVIND